MSSENTETIEIFRAKALTASASNYMGQEFQLGEGWAKLQMRLNLALTIGSGSGAVSEGELQIAKAVHFRTDKGEIIANNMPGRSLYRMAQIKSKAAPVKDAIAASTATYRVPLDLHFSDPLMRPEQQHATILNTKRYGAVYLTFQLGGLSDLLTTVGSASLVATMDAYVDRFRGLLPPEMEPELYRAYGVQPPQNPNNQTYIDLDKSENLAYSRVQIFSTSGASAGVPHSGTAADDVISDLDIEATEKFSMQNTLADFLQRKNAQEYGLTALVAGTHTHSWVDKSKNLEAVLLSGGLSRLRVNWRNGASLPSNPQVTAAFEGVRPLAGIA